MPDETREFDKLETTITSLFEKLDGKVDDCSEKLVRMDKQLAVMAETAKNRDARMSNMEKRLAKVEDWKEQTDKDNVRRNTLLVTGGGGLGAFLTWLYETFGGNPPQS